MGNSSNISIHFQLQKEAITVKGAKKRATAVKMLTWNNENLSAWFRTCSFNISLSELLRVFFGSSNWHLRCEIRFEILASSQLRVKICMFHSCFPVPDGSNGAVWFYCLSLCLHIQLYFCPAGELRSKMLFQQDSGLWLTMTVQPQTIKKVKCSLLLPPLCVTKGYLDNLPSCTLRAATYHWGHTSTTTGWLTDTTQRYQMK